MRETRLSGSEGGGARTRSPYPYRCRAVRARPLGVASRQKRMCGPGGRAGFQPAGSWSILPQVSGRTRRSDTNARLEAARTGRRGRLPYGAGHSGRDHWE